jgi:hypothetical protein
MKTAFTVAPSLSEVGELAIFESQEQAVSIAVEHGLKPFEIKWNGTDRASIFIVEELPLPKSNF